MNMMNMNWREAIKQAQQKIDKVLDIRAENEEEPASSADTSKTTEEIVVENQPSEISSSTISADEPVVVTFEPLLPPSSHGHLTSDDIQTIVSSDIETLPEVITPNVSPELTDCVELPDSNEILQSNKWLQQSLEVEQRKIIELKEQNAKLGAKSITIEKEFESFKSEASKFSQEAFKARQDAKASRAKIAELTKELEAMEEKLSSRDTKIKGMKSAMEDNLAIVKKYSTSNTSQAENIKKLNDENIEKTNKIRELEAIIDSFQTKQHDEETGTLYMDDMLEQTVAGLREEVDEYKKANYTLTENLRKLEEEMEMKQLDYERRMTDAVEATRSKYVTEISELIAEREKMQADVLQKSEKNKKLTELLNSSMSDVENLKKDVSHLRKGVSDLNSQFGHEIKRAQIEIRRLLNENYDEIRKDLFKKLKNSMPKTEERVGMSEKFTQTDQKQEDSDSQTFVRSEEQKNENCWCSGIQDKKFVTNMSEMMKMVDELSFQKDQLETIKRTTDLELKETRRQLSEVLIMHGEKIEELEELRIDNEDLRNILKEQALSLTVGADEEANS